MIKVCLIWLLGISVVFCGEEPGKLTMSLEELLDIPISTAAKYQQKIGEAPASVKIVTTEDIQRYGYRTIGDVLRSIAGFYVTYDRNYWYLGTRGFSRPTDYNDRILLLLNGHAANENVFLSAYIGTESYVPLDDVERIEIVRGPGSALYGTNAMFAVINVITKTGKQLDGVRVSPLYGSFNTRGASASAGRTFLNDELDLMVSGGWFYNPGEDQHYREYDDSAAGRGIAHAIDWEKYWGVLSTLSYKGFSLRGFASSRQKSVPTASYGTVFNDPFEKTLDQNAFVELQKKGAISPKLSYMATADFSHYDYQGGYPYETEYIDAMDNPYYVYEKSSDSSNGNWADLKAQVIWDPLPNNRLTAGVDYLRHFDAFYGYWTASPEGDYVSFWDNFPYYNLGIFAEDEYRVLDNLSFTAGLRYDNHSREGSAINPRAAAIYAPGGKTTLKLLYGEAFRAPNLWEKYYEDGYLNKANPDLSPEKIRTIEVVCEQKLADWLFSTASVFGYRMKNQIDERVDPDDGLAYFDNTTRVDAKGVELSLDARLPNGVNGYLNYTFQHALQMPEGIKLSNSPSSMAKMGLSSPVGAHLNAALELYYETSRKSIDVFDTVSAPAFLADLHLRTATFCKHVRAAASVRNVFGARYSNPGGFEHAMPLIEQDGRTFYLTMDFLY